jgi:predicted enzyme related to lactoylglutathione lyase
MARVVHFEIQVDDVERAKQFYASAFEWSFVDYGHVAGSPYWGVLTGPADQPGIDGGLLVRPASSPAVGQGTNAFVCTVQVEDYDATERAILDAGGQVALPKQALTGMAWQGYYLDTEGNTFGIHQPDPEAKDPDPSDDLKQLAADSIADLGDGQAVASVPGASGHDDPQRRREVVDTVFDDPRIHGADHVTVTVPRGDTEALDQVRGRLEDEHTRSAGSTVIVEGRPSGDVPEPADDGSNLPQGPNAND